MDVEIMLKSLFQCWSEHPAFTSMMPRASFPEPLEKWVHMFGGSLAPCRMVLHIHSIISPRHGAHRAKAPGYLWRTQSTISFQGERQSFYNICNKFYKIQS